MNEETLSAGRAMTATVREVEAKIRASVADLSVPEPWPGRDQEAAIHSERALEFLQAARAEISTLYGVLAQDGAP